MEKNKNYEEGFNDAIKVCDTWIKENVSASVAVDFLESLKK